MKKLLKFLILAFGLSAMMATSCEREVIPEYIPNEYTNLEITAFSVPEFPAAGQTVTPLVEYRYNIIADRGTPYEKVSTFSIGCEVTFETDSPFISVDNDKLTLTAALNETVLERTATVKVIVTKKVNGKTMLEASRQMGTRQEGNVEEVLSSTELQLPLHIAPHECVEFQLEGEGINRKEVKYLNDVWNQTKYISVLGAELEISGGQFVRMDTYRSGRIDTVVLCEPTFTTTTKYDYVEYEAGVANIVTYTDETAPDWQTGHPSSYYKDGKWIINKTGVGIIDTVKGYHNGYKNNYYNINKRYQTIKHTIKAYADGNVLEITLNQMPNRQLGLAEKKYEILEHRHDIQRRYYNFPNIEDFPPGSNPKWLKDYEVFNMYDYDAEIGTIDDFDNTYSGFCQRAWHNFYLTKDLHPDGNRDITLMQAFRVRIYPEEMVYLSGDRIKNLDIYETPDHQSLEIARAYATIEADVKFADNQIHHITHTYEWDDKYADFKESGYHFPCNMHMIKIIIPVVEEAVEDFEWHIKFEYQYQVVDNGREFVNPEKLEMPTQTLEYTAWDRKTRIVEDWLDKTTISGFVSNMGNNIPSWNPYLIDGEPSGLPTWSTTKGY